MRENKLPSYRFICGVAFFYVALAFIAGYARKVGILLDSPRDWRMIELALSVTSGNQLAYLHWQRIVPDSSKHWLRLTFPMILHQLVVCVVAFIVIHFVLS